MLMHNVIYFLGFQQGQPAEERLQHVVRLVQEELVKIELCSKGVM